MVEILRCFSPAVSAPPLTGNAQVCSAPPQIHRSSLPQIHPPSSLDPLLSAMRPECAGLPRHLQSKGRAGPRAPRCATPRQGGASDLWPPRRHRRRVSEDISPESQRYKLYSCVHSCGRNCSFCLFVLWFFPGTHANSLLHGLENLPAA